MIRISDVFIVITPFQKREMEKIFSDKIGSKKTLVIRSNIVSDFAENRNVLALDFEGFSIFRFLKNPIKQVVKVRKYFANINDILDDIECQYIFEKGLNLYIGSDKDHFTQLFINRHVRARNKSRLIAIDEGTGYYIRENALDYLYRLIYPIFSYMIFGNKINYIRCLGKDKRIHELYLRYPDLVPYRSSKVSYNLIRDSNVEVVLNSKRRDVLFFSFPEEDYNKNFEFKSRLFLHIRQTYLKRGEYLYIKPHPRENVMDLRRFVKENHSIRLMENEVLGEDMSFANYAKIVNFSSSIIFHLLSINYPLGDIITIGFRRSSSITIFNSTVYLKYSSIIKN